MKFSIVTPSFRNSEWLKLCIASVADQQGVELEHIVQDAGSDDGTQDWLPRDSRVKAFIEKDGGMYDAINRGYRRATGDILAHLNCDEQYLPGALAAVAKFFAENPKVELLLAGSIVTDSDGQYLCHRHSLVPLPQAIWFRFPVLTSSLFLRRKVIHERGLFFDTSWRVIGDLHWVASLLRAGVPMSVSQEVTSAFADTGENLCITPAGAREAEKTFALLPRWIKMLKPFWVGHNHLRRLVAGHFHLKPMSYAIYTKSSPGHRVVVNVPHPTALWRNRR